MPFSILFAGCMLFIAFVLQFLVSQVWIGFKARSIGTYAIEIIALSLLTAGFAGPGMGLAMMVALVLATGFGLMWWVFMPRAESRYGEPLPHWTHQAPTTRYRPGQLYDGRH